MSAIWECCIAFENKPVFSIVEWFCDDDAKSKNVILQVDGRYEKISGAFCSGVFRLLAGITVSPAIKESKYRKNPTPLAIVVDEMGVLGKLELNEFLASGRSKSITAVLATQVQEHVRSIYGEHALGAWMGMIGTKIYGRVTGAEAVKYAQQQAGESIYWMPSETITTAADGSTSRSVSHQKDPRQVIDVKQLGSLGKRKDKLGVNLFYLLPAPVIDWVPFVFLPKLREGVRPNSDFGRSVPKMIDDDARAALVASLQQVETIKHLPEPTSDDSTDFPFVPDFTCGSDVRATPMADLHSSVLENPVNTVVSAQAQTFEPILEPVSEESVLNESVEHVVINLAEHLVGIDGLGLALEIVEVLDKAQPSRADSARDVAASRKTASINAIRAAKVRLAERGEKVTNSALAAESGVSVSTIKRLSTEIEE